MNKEQLDAALKCYPMVDGEWLKNTLDNVDKRGPDTGKIIVQAAKQYTALLPLLEALAEARDKFAPNTYKGGVIKWSDSLNALTYWGLDGDALFACCGDWSGSEVDDMNFITTAADLTTQITKIIRSE